VAVSSARTAHPIICPPLLGRTIGLAACFVLLGSQGLQNANAVGDTRTISLHHIHTNEDLTITFKKDGRYDEEALKKINWIMRDWRKEQQVKMDPHAIDLLWEVQNEVGAKSPIHIVCGYRSPETNNMLRRRSKGVARVSQHMVGKAIDFFIPGVPVEQVRNAALRLQGGGVGYYPTSGSPFVHLDVGSVRHWPRMTRDQLAKVFPNGRTVHVPTDGNPLPGYELALAEIERGQARRPAEKPSRNLFAALFSGAQDTEETSDSAAAQQSAAPAAAPTPAPAPRRPIQTAAVATPAQPAPSAPPVPLPHSRPTAQIAAQIAAVETRQREFAAAEERSRIQVAAIASPPAPPSPPVRPVVHPAKIAELTPNDIINVRGLWNSMPGTMAPAAAAPSVMSSARRAPANQVASAAPELTASIGPFDRPDRSTPDAALAYAAQSNAQQPARQPRREPAQRNTQGGFADRFAPTAPAPGPRGAAAVALKPTLATRHAELARRLNDPWLRSLVLVSSVQDHMIVTPFGEPDYTQLLQHMQKPAAAVMMTFSIDAYPGLTNDAFTGSAVVFQSTVSFGLRTAALR
jgi:uncharacterized protein YcbK (DUF882 family)